MHLNEAKLADWHHQHSLESSNLTYKELTGLRNTA